ncbi:hypothetical protein SKAU_G00031110 [Synaphobranchus kaupii]|uniref:Uncharacterized protein n=1 Tax=Synaphobranchus kaupii TaxID=118154 RepID=A0A9Q1JE50_SYNKA|nr:hypothetical protein SKAU_G00031110 [Synaphobranchus kaupii]
MPVTATVNTAPRSREAARDNDTEQYHRTMPLNFTRLHHASQTSARPGRHAWRGSHFRDSRRSAWRRDEWLREETLSRASVSHIRRDNGENPG